MLSSMLQRYAATYHGFSKQTWTVTFASFFNALGQVMGIFVSLYMNAIGYDIHAIGIAIATYGIGFFIGSTLCGYLCEKYNPKNVIIISMLLNSITVAAVVINQNLFFIFAILALCGMTSSIVRPASVLLIKQLEFAENRARALGLRRVGINLGWGVGATFCGILTQYSYSYIFLFSAVMIFLAGLYLLVSKTYQSINIDIFKPQSCDSDSKQNSKHAISKFWIITLIYLITVTVFLQMRSTFPVYMKDIYKASPNCFTYLFALNCLIIVLIEVPLLTYLRNIKQYYLAAVGSLLICAGFAVLPISNNPGIPYISCVLWSLGEILFYPTMLNVMLNTIKTNHGRYTGFYQSAYSIGTMISPVFGTMLYRFNHGALLWSVCGVLGIITFLKTIGFLRD